MKKYICPALLVLLVLLSLASWLIPNAVEWESTQLKTCVDLEMAQKDHDSKAIETQLRDILTDPCREYFHGYIAAVSATNPHHQAIMNDPEQSAVIYKKFEDIAVLWLSTLYHP